MESIFIKSEQYGLQPNCEDSLAMFDKIPNGALVKVEYVKTRNYANHKRFFAFLRVAFDNQDFYENKEHFRKAIQMIGGNFEELVILAEDGTTTTQYIPKSIAFDKMEEGEFQALFDRCITGFINRYGNGISEQEILRIIEFG